MSSLPSFKEKFTLSGVMIHLKKKNDSEPIWIILAQDLQSDLHLKVWPGGQQHGSHLGAR